MAAKKKKKAKRLSGRFAIFVTVLLFVCTIIFLNNQFSAGSLRRVAYWVFNGVRGDATDVSVSFDANEYNRFSLLSQNLCIVSPETLSVYKLSGKPALSTPVLLRNPAISSSGSRFIAYDLGGLNFYVANNRKILYHESTDAKIVNVNMNKTGAFAVVTDSDKSKSLVTLYNSSFKPILKFHSSEKYVFDAAISPNQKTAAIITYGAKNGQFESSLSLCHTNSDEFFKTVSLGSSMPLRATYQSDSKLIVVCDDRTLMFDGHGEQVCEMSYNSLPVKAFAISPGKHTVLALDNYQNGGNTKLLFMTSNGEDGGTLEFNEEIFSISAAGNYTSVQFSDKCVVYDENLEVHCEFSIPTTVSRCIVNSDSSVLSISENSATFYVE